MKRMVKMTLIFILVGISVFIKLNPTSAADFPEKKISLLTWGSPGSGGDLFTRTIGKISEKYFGVPVVVLNKSAGGGAAMMNYLLSSPANGYTVGYTTLSGYARIASGVIKIDPMAFDYILRAQKDPYMIAVRTDSPFKSLGDLVGYAKNNPKKLNISGGYATGSAPHLFFETFAKEAGIKANWIPFTGGGAAVLDTLGGHGDAVYTNIKPALGQVEAGKMRFLAIASEKRLSGFPDAPTLIDLGYNVTGMQWRGIMVRGGTPPEIKKVLHDGFKKTIDDPEFKKFLEKSFTEYGYLSSEDFTKFIRELMETLPATMKELGLKTK